MLKKINKKLVFLVVVILCVLSLAGILLSNYFRDIAKDEKNAYIALQYLGIKDYDIASGYLEKVDSKTSKKVDFARGAAEVIEQSLIGNNTLYKIKLDILTTDFSMNDERTSIMEELQTVDAETSSYSYLIADIVDSMDISAKKLEQYQLQFDIESQAMINGYLDETRSQEYADMCGKDEEENLQLTVALSSGDYNAAVKEAADRVAKKPSSKNRLLLADILARAAYAGYSIDESVFYYALGKEYNVEQAYKESQEIQEKMAKLQERITNLQNQIYDETNGSKTTELNERLEDLYDQQNELSNKSNYKIIYKAMNSISNVPTAEAEIVQAKLYYAMGKKEQAIDTLVDASDSIAVKLSSNDAAKQGLDLIRGLSSGEVDTSVTKQSSANQMIKNMFDSTIDIRVKKQSDYYMTSLADDLTNSILAEYKYQNNEVYISAFDESNFPEISFTVTARDEILEDILDKDNCIIKDTHYEVKYNAETEDDVNAAICFVVDISGSMSGEPLENAREALISFADTLDAGTEVSLVTFDDAGYIVTPVTTDIYAFTAASGNIIDGGGTNISAGINSGIEALQEATGAKNIILMTDGQSDVDYTVADEAASQGITIFTIGFGDVNTEVLEEIAERTDGTFTLAASSGDLTNVYESIGALIGSRVRITYTVTDSPEDVPRYAFVRCENFNASKKYEYRTEEEKSCADGFYITNSMVYSLQDMEWNANDSGMIWCQFETSNSTDIVSLEINGQEIIPELDESGIQISFEMGAITQEGLYDITVNFKDGSQYVVKDVIVVYDNERENSYIYYDEIHIGSVILNPSNIIMMPDGTAVLTNTTLYDNVLNDEYTLNACTNNLIVLENFTFSDQTFEDGYYLNWGDSAQFHMDGVLILNGSDAQNSNGGTSISAIGKLVGYIDNEQCRITQE